VLPLAVALLLAQAGENIREAPPPPAQAAPELTRAPRLVEFHAAEYPKDRLERGETADVACLVDIDAQGLVTNVEVVTGAAPDFDQAAVAAIRSFRFSPAEIDGKPAPVRIRYVYHFVIEKRRVERPAVLDAGRIRGSIVEAGNRHPVAGAEVSIDGAAAATTDAQGAFEVAEVPAGRHELRVDAVDFARDRRTVEVAARGTAEVRVYLRRSSVGEFAAVVEGERARDAPTVRTLKHDELVNVPGSLNDPIRAVQNLPGMARAPFLAGLLLVRGTPPQDTGTYLDGHRIPILYHFLGGPSVINEQLIDRIDFYPGGYGAYYGRNLTSALDVGTRKADSTLHGSFSLDLLQAVAFVEGPLGERTQGAIAARRSYIDLFLPLFLPNNPKDGVTAVTPIYWDYQARIDHRLLNGDQLSLFALGTDDSLAVVQKGGKLAAPIVLDTHTGAHQLRLSWMRPLSSDFSVSLSPLAGIITTSFDSSGLGQGTFRNQQTLTLVDYQLALRAESRYRANGALSLRTGLDGSWDRYRVEADIESSLQLRGLGSAITQPLHIDHSQVLCSIGEYVEGDARLGRFQLVPGLRFDQFLWRDHSYGVVDPRLWLRYPATEATAIKAYAGIYHQAPNPANIDPSIGNPDLTPERSWQTGLGVEHRFNPAWNLSVEGFYLRRGALVSRVPATSVNGIAVDNPLYGNVGIARSYGVEVLLRHEFTGRLYGWVAYTLSHSDVLPLPDVSWRAFNFDQPHNLIVVAGYRPTPSWEISTRYRLVSGNPSAPVDRATFDSDSGRFVADTGTFGASRLPAFSQLDMRAQYSFVHDVWKLAVYLDVQNVLNHRNQEIHLYDYRYRADGYIGGLPILPTLGLKASF